MQESWRTLPDFDNIYQVDREGRIRRVYSSGKCRLLHPFIKQTSKNSHMVINLKRNGKQREINFSRLIAEIFLGPCPEGCVVYHKNGCISECYVNNLAYINRKKLGQMTGAKSRRRPVAKVNSEGEFIQFYSSAREAAKDNFFSYQTILDRCNGVYKGVFASDGYAYIWDDDDHHIQTLQQKIE